VFHLGDCQLVSVVLGTLPLALHVIHLVFVPLLLQLSHVGQLELNCTRGVRAAALWWLQLPVHRHLLCAGTFIWALCQDATLALPPHPALGNAHVLGCSPHGVAFALDVVIGVVAEAQPRPLAARSSKCRPRCRSAYPSARPLVTLAGCCAVRFRGRP